MLLHCGGQLRLWKQHEMIVLVATMQDVIINGGNVWWQFFRNTTNKLQVLKKEGKWVQTSQATLR